MVNCVECGAPLGRADESCTVCSQQAAPGGANGKRRSRLEDPDALVYEDAPFVHDDADQLRHHHHRRHEPYFVSQPLHDDPTVESRDFALDPAAAAVVPGSFSRRALALIIDLVILSFLDGVLLALATAAVLLAESVSGARVGGAVELVRAAISVGSMTLFLGYFSVLHARSGQTLGKAALRLHVQETDGAPVGIPRSVLRTLAYALSALPLGAGFLLALGSRHRALHDRIAGTVVVVRSRGS